MCLILFANDAHPRYRLIVAANRDEFHDRPSAPADFRSESPGLLAGRDLKRGGTWLGITRNGRVAFLSNYRKFPQPEDGRLSRGRLPLDFLLSEVSPEEFLGSLKACGTSYSGFNLVFGMPGSLFYFSNRGGNPHQVSRGVHGLSNHLLDTPWPKVSRGKEMLGRLLEDEASPDTGSLFAILADRTAYQDEFLPDTGIGLERERTLSSSFIVSPAYGTRCSTLLMVDTEGQALFIERRFDSAAKITGESRFSFAIDPGPAPVQSPDAARQ